MSVIKVTKNDVENITLVTTPRRHYVSSSAGVTGSVKVFPRRSGIEKDTEATTYFQENKAAASVDDNYIDAANKHLEFARALRSIGQPIDGPVGDGYMQLVNKMSQRKTETLQVERFTPTTQFTKYTLCKNNVKNVLMKYHRLQYPTSVWAYSNYHSLNFFTAYDGPNSMVPTGSVLLYPNAVDADLPGQAGHVSGSYCLTGAFSFDFYVNPRYKVDGTNQLHFKDGAVFHLSSSYAVSLATGSRKDENGLPDGFRIKLQLSHSADYPPSLSSPGSYPHDLTFLSDDNSLTYNNWHRVVVRWGTSAINQGTGSFIVDGVNRGNFVVPSGTIMPKAMTSILNPDVLCIGNFYEGKNVGNDAMSLFFGERPATRDGLLKLTNDNVQDEPDEYFFRHPLKAELHDVVFRRRYVTDAEMAASGSIGIGSVASNKDDVAFYLPPFFVPESPTRRYVGDYGGIPQTPFFEVNGTSEDPFNVAMAFGVNGHLINLENFTKDIATGRFPRLLRLTASTIDFTTTAQEANSFLYADGGVAKRNLTVLPCDDGNFEPDYSPITLGFGSPSAYFDKYLRTATSEIDYSYVNLDDLVNPLSLKNGGAPPGTPEDYVQELLGPNPEFPGLEPGSAAKKYVEEAAAKFATADKFDPGVQAGTPLTIYQRLLDPSSNQVTFFNFSNLYYGRRILPGSFVIRDSGISGSYGSVPITLRDDGIGNLYRGDSATPHDTQNSVGNIFYDEGIVVVKSPHLYFFGKGQYEVSFRGVQHVHSTKYEILAPTGLLNSSSNPSYAMAGGMKPSSSPVDNETFVYISGLNFHDSNMNVVAKVKLAQPIIKREGDKLLFKVAFDW